MSFEYQTGEGVRRTGDIMSGPLKMYDNIYVYNGKAIDFLFLTATDLILEATATGGYVIIRDNNAIPTNQITLDGSNGDISTTGKVDGIDVSAIPATYVLKAGDTMGGNLTAPTFRFTSHIDVSADNLSPEYRFSLTASAGPSIVGNGGDAGFPGYLTFYYGDNRAGKTPASKVIFYYLANAGAGGQTLAIDQRGCMLINSVAAANAPNSSLYYSTTSNKLVWKDAGGTERPLY